MQDVVNTRPQKAIDILLVEDSPGDAQLVRMALLDAQQVNSFHHVTDGVDALAFLHREGPFVGAPRPDLVLLDLNMPRMNGRDVLAAIRASADLRDIPVVALTTSESQSDITYCYKTGANAYITKPVDLDELFERIRTLQAFWASVVTLPPKA